MVRARWNLATVTQVPAGARRSNWTLRPGEFVEVRSEPEILQTLDEQGRHRGLAWMPNMARCCGKRYTVYKRVERIMLESSGEIRVVRNTVLLDGAVCENLYGCDRSCYHFWREAWLKRVPAEQVSQKDSRDHSVRKRSEMGPLSMAESNDGRHTP